MREFDDVDQHFERHMSQAAERYTSGLQHAGLEPSPTLTKAVAERALHEARESYTQHATEVRDHNIAVVVRNHKKQMRRLRREGARLRLQTCPPIALLFGFLAWYSFGQPNGRLVGILFAIGALAFLLMLILGAIFDRPR